MSDVDRREGNAVEPKPRAKFRAEILLIGVEEPQARIHAPNESVAPQEIAAMALAEALFLRNYGASAG